MRPTPSDQNPTARGGRPLHGPSRPARERLLPAQAQVFGSGAQVGRRFGQMGQTGIGPARKRGFGPNFFDIFPKNYEISIGLHSDGPNELMG